ncbi:sugar transferase [Acetohalobium arabaticum]|uniref:Undecaprenyl-phosphate galactose phosphotransferase n=1 Tax=Acetohalobium arabaticum (strain ATCC 49924 / DSM 5501 / Z-7288) TaxID=574087 RepID=D9QTA4_ACEAZ|nr:sugar transferase [Acetohalobium arabaticum]ADL13604.1 Undecaprenyl-phosphate galactose phosphotransferase [Acetohalobium arabaticum DSM 5501]
MLIKRVIDFFGSLVGLVILLPLFIIISLLIKIDSKGPVFFKQDRLGKDGEVFEIYKFRTMVENAENIGDGLFTSKGDPRITKVGKLLRKISLDELPQLINVLKGDMSLIGPRPPVPYYPYKYDEYSDEQKSRFDVKPGITGYAQINGRNNLSWDERIEYDIEYVKNFSLLLDLKIIFSTLAIVLKRDGIYGENKKKVKK